MEAGSAPACRICQGDSEPLLRPCRCEGTMAYAHPYCLAQWIALHGRLACEVCGAAYTLQVVMDDVPPPLSLPGLRMATKVLVMEPLRRLCRMLVTPLQILACVLALPPAISLMWIICVKLVMPSSHTIRDLPPPPLGLLYGCGISFTFPSAVVLYVFKAFREWVFLHEHLVAGLPPDAPAPPPPDVAEDDTAASMLNEAFTRSHAASPTSAQRRYLATVDAQLGERATLQLLRAKVRASRSPAPSHNSWSSTVFRYAGQLLAVHGIGSTAIVLGHATLRTATVLCSLLAVVPGHALPAGMPPTLRLRAIGGATLAAVPPYAHWATAYIVGIIEWSLLLGAAARWCRGRAPRLARPAFLCGVFTRMTATLLVLLVAWAVLIPGLVYGCLFPFFVEGDVAAVMSRQDALQVLRAERLLPIPCNATSAAAPLLQPLNVARALVVALYSVWRGDGPPLVLLLDPATCRVASTAAAQQSPVSVAEMCVYAVMVLLRVCTFSTWNTLVMSMRGTLAWVLVGAFAVLSPLTSFAKRHAESDFLSALLRLSATDVWRTLAEVLLLVALYTATAGFGAMACLQHLFPETLPKPLTPQVPLSAATLSAYVGVFYRVLCTFVSLHRSMQRRLRHFFLPSTAAAPTETAAAAAAAETRRRGGDVVEYAAYIACLLCANVLIGATLEWVSWHVGPYALWLLPGVRRFAGAVVLAGTLWRRLVLLPLPWIGGAAQPAFGGPPAAEARIIDGGAVADAGEGGEGGEGGEDAARGQMQQQQFPPQPVHEASEASAPPPWLPARARAKLHRWLASELASDVVIVAYPRAPAPEQTPAGDVAGAATG